MYGPLIAGFTAVNFLSIPFWYKAGKNYVAFMKEKKAKKEAKAARKAAEAAAAAETADKA